MHSPSPYEIDVQVDAEMGDAVDAERLSRVAETVLRIEGQPTGTALTLVITIDAAIQEMNRLYRGADRPTDVLAFAAHEGEAFALGDDDFGRYLGDAIVSYETAVEQARDEGHAVSRELDLLTIHGCLHLLGYDDEEPHARQRMWARQQEILESL